MILDYQNLLLTAKKDELNTYSDANVGVIQNLQGCGMKPYSCRFFQEYYVRQQLDETALLTLRISCSSTALMCQCLVFCNGTSVGGGIPWITIPIIRYILSGKILDIAR